MTANAPALFCPLCTRRTPCREDSGTFGGDRFFGCLGRVMEISQLSEKSRFSMPLAGWRHNKAVDAYRRVFKAPDGYGSGIVYLMWIL